MKKCDKCGNILKDDQIFCNKCGTKWVDWEAIRIAEQKAAEEKAKWEEEEKKRKIAEEQERIRRQEEDRRRRMAENEAILAAKQVAAQEKIRLKQQRKAERAEKKGASKSLSHENGLKNVKVQDNGDISTFKAFLKPLKVIELVYLILATILVLGLAFSTPEFSASGKDVFLYRLSYFFGMGIFFIFPGAVLLFNPLRNHIPLFNKNKIGFTIIGWFLCCIIGVTVSIAIDSFHTDEYKSIEAKHNVETESLEVKDDTKADAKSDNEKGSENKEVNTKDNTTKEAAAVDIASTKEDANVDASSTKDTIDSNKKKAELTEDEYKALCVDIPWAEVTKDRKTYVGTYLKKDLMVREIATDSITDETVYLCGENKGDGSYVGGTFTVYDRRSDKSQPIELYDKLYTYGKITGIYMTWSSYNPEYKVKYVQFNGKFGE